jgi:DNA-directed RNA polymerase subunit RPC12/RpoP
MGGYRKGSGRSKHGYYKGIYCGSTYELCWVIYSLDNGVKFNRFPGCIVSDNIKYYPDFLLDDKKTIIETKGYESRSSVNKKTKIAEKAGYNVVVLRKDDLKHIFDYVKQTYHTDKFYTLYDNYKPIYSYICTNCVKEFTRDKQIKTEEKFCCRECSGTYRKQKNTKLYKNGDIFVNCETRALTKDIALKIFHDMIHTIKELAKIYSVSVNVIYHLKEGRTYKWIHNT